MTLLKNRELVDLTDSIVLSKLEKEFVKMFLSKITALDIISSCIAKRRSAHKPNFIANECALSLLRERLSEILGLSNPVPIDVQNTQAEAGENSPILLFSASNKRQLAAVCQEQSSTRGDGSEIEDDVSGLGNNSPRKRGRLPFDGT